MNVNLAEVINTIRYKISLLENEREKEILQVEEKYQKLIEKYKTALEILEEINEVCLNCGGSGFEKYIDASGNWDTRKCHVCNGTGMKK